MRSFFSSVVVVLGLVAQPVNKEVRRSNAARAINLFFIPLPYASNMPPSDMVNKYFNDKALRSRRTGALRHSCSKTGIRRFAFGMKNSGGFGSVRKQWLRPNHSARVVQRKRSGAGGFGHPREIIEVPGLNYRGHEMK